MDVGPEYILQCKKATEIQKAQISKDVVIACPKHMCLIKCYHGEDTRGDSFGEYYCPVYREQEWDAEHRIYVITDKNTTPVRFIDTTENMDRHMGEFRVANECKEEEWVWLPRQDELEEMVEEHHKRQRPEFEKTHREAQTAVILREIVKFNDNKYHESMEQLWLAFVMEEKFNKVWSKDEGEWVGRQAFPLSAKFKEVESGR